MPDQSNRPGSEPANGELIVSKGEDSGSFRRFSDKIMWGTLCLAAALIAAVWGLTWVVTDRKVSDVNTRAAAIETIQMKHAEKLIRLEVMQEQNELHLRGINAKQSVLEGQVQGVQQSLNQVLLELRKGK